MDIAKILDELRAEREQLDEAIISPEIMAASGARRRGRPPAWLIAAKQEGGTKKRGRPPGIKNGPPE